MSPTHPTNPVLFRVFSLGLTTNVIAQNEIVAWADGVILKDDAPDSFVVELSLVGNRDKNDIITLLNGFIGPEMAPVAGRVVLGLVYRRFVDGKLSLKNAVSAIDMLIRTAGLSEEEQRLMLPLDDGYALATSSTFGTVETIETETMRFLEVYKEFRLDNMHEWQEIDATIADKIKRLKQSDGG